jgi:hypothetical protein
MRFTRLWEETAIVSLNSVNLLVFVMEAQCEIFWTETWNIL